MGFLAYFEPLFNSANFKNSHIVYSYYLLSKIKASLITVNFTGKELLS